MRRSTVAPSEPSSTDDSAVLRTVMALNRSEANTLKSNDRPRFVAGAGVSAARRRQRFHAVDANTSELRAEAAHGNLATFASVASQRHARNALNGFGQVEVRNLPNVLGKDGVDGARFGALHVQRLIEARAEAVTTISSSPPSALRRGLRFLRSGDARHG